MKKLNYALPAKAKEIIEELASSELYQVSFYMYAAFCLSNHGYECAAKHFMNEAENERYHFKRFSDFLQSRGIEMDVPAVKKIDEDYDDLKSIIEAAFEMEIAVTERYEEAIKQMRDIDAMAYLKLCDFMTGQQWALDSFQKMWAVFGDLEEADQKEQDKLYFAPKTESAPAIV